MNFVGIASFIWWHMLLSHQGIHWQIQVKQMEQVLVSGNDQLPGFNKGAQWPVTQSQPPKTLRSWPPPPPHHHHDKRDQWFWFLPLHFQLKVKSELQEFRFYLKDCTVIISGNQMSCENWHMASELLFDDNRSLLILQSSHIRRAEYKRALD